MTWRSATWDDIEPSLSIQPAGRGDALVGKESCLAGWRQLVHSPFFTSAVLEANPAIQGHRLIGFGGAVIVSPAFAESELAHPRPDITSRVIAGIHSGQPVLATRNEVARVNAGEGIEIVILYCAWRDEILAPEERQDVQTLLASSFTQVHAGYRIRRIIAETTYEPVKEFLQGSVVYRPIADFPELGRVIHLMTRESVKAMPASLGNVLFNFHEPMLRLRDSDQQLLLAALRGATDPELAIELGVTLAAVKARWRSTFVRIAETMPGLVSEVDNPTVRGAQKRHRVLAYVRNHPEELRPYDWKTKPQDSKPSVLTTTA